MFSSSSHLRVERIPLTQLQVIEIGKPWTCHPEKVMEYTKLLQAHPDMDLDPIMTRPNPEYPGMFAIQNGKHRYLSYVLAGRSDQPCVVEEPA